MGFLQDYKNYLVNAETGEKHEKVNEGEYSEDCIANFTVKDDDCKKSFDENRANEFCTECIYMGQGGKCKVDETPKNYYSEKPKDWHFYCDGFTLKDKHLLELKNTDKQESCENCKNLVVGYRLYVQGLVHTRYECIRERIGDSCKFEQKER